MRIMITGELGMLATALELELVRDGFEVVWGRNCQEEDLCNHMAMHGGMELDFCAQRDFERAITYSNPDVVIHTGALVGSEMCEKSPLSAFHSNVWGTYIVVKMCEKYHKKLLYFSTTAVYEPIDGIINESASKKPGTIYGQTKHLGECLVKSSHLDWMVLYPCFVYGSKLDTHSAISRLVRSNWCIDSEEILLNGSKLKDYMYVSDFVNAVSLLLRNWCSGGEFNVSYGMPIPFLDVADAICRKLSGVKYHLVPESDYLGNHWVESIKLRNWLSWEPKVPLVDGIDRMINDCQS